MMSMVVVALFFIVQINKQVVAKVEKVDIREVTKMLELARVTFQISIFFFLEIEETPALARIDIANIAEASLFKEWFLWDLLKVWVGVANIPANFLIIQ